jgi:predicted neuraminidase
VRSGLWLAALALPLAAQVKVERLFGPEVQTGRYKHPASIERFDNGDLYVVYYTGEGEYANATSLYASRRKAGGAAWSAPKLVARDPFRSVGNGAAWQAPDGRVWLFYVIRFGADWPTSRSAAKVSDDRGETWSDSSLITLEQGMMVRGRPIALSDGRYLLPAYFEKGEREFTTAETRSVFFEWAPQTKEWRLSGEIRSAKGNLQPAIAETAPGRLVAFCRRAGGYGPVSDGYLIYSESRDNGRTWSPGVNSELKNPNSAVDLLKLRSGNLLLVFNDSMSDRTPLVAALSSDGGRTWPHRLTVAGGRGSFAYPSAVEAPGGVIHLVFTSDERTVVRYATFTEADLLKR